MMQGIKKGQHNTVYFPGDSPFIAPWGSREVVMNVCGYSLIPGRDPPDQDRSSRGLTDSDPPDQDRSSKDYTNSDQIRSPFASQFHNCFQFNFSRVYQTL